MERWTTISCTAGSWDFRPKAIWDPTTFTKNRDRLQTVAVFAKFMTKLLNHPEVKPLLSDEHFGGRNADRAWASHKSSAPRTAAATTTAGPTSTASSAKIARMQAPAIPIAVSTARPPGGKQSSVTWRCHHGEPAWVGDRRHGLPCQRHCRAPRFADHAQGQSQGGRPPHHSGEDKAYDTVDHVAHLRAINVTPHVTQNNSVTSTGKRRQSAIDGRTSG